MIACSIALAIWTAGLSYLTRREGKRRVVEEHVVEQGHADSDHDTKKPAELA